MPIPALGPNTPKRAPKQDSDTLALQLDRWTRAREGHRRWAEEAATCVRFVEGQQYSPSDLKALEEAGVPALTLNKIAPLVRLLRGYFRANRYDIRYLPGADGSGMPEIAEILTRLSKHIDERCQTKWIDALVFDDGLTAGRGFWDIRLDFTHTVLGEVLERVQDPFATFIDPEADDYDPEEWGFVQTSRWMSWEDIQQVYGKAAAEGAEILNEGSMPVTNMEAPEFDEVPSPARFFGQVDPDDWDLTSYGISPASIPLTDMINRKRKLIRVIDCQHRVMKRVQQFISMRTGQKLTIPDDWDRNRIAEVVQWAEAHRDPVTVQPGVERAVRWTTSAADRLLYDDWSLYKSFTIVPYFPSFRRGVSRGLVHDLLDPQREINKMRSAGLHVLMTTANSGWLIEEDSMEEEVERQVEEEGAAPGIHIKYKKGAQKPERIVPPPMPQGFKNYEQAGAQDLFQIAGINESAMGQLDRVQSGRAIEARQRQAVVGAELYFDNFARSQELKGRIRKDLIQGFYTEERMIRVRSGETDEDEEIRINYRDAAGQIRNNIAAGTFSVTVDQAPVSSTFMQAALEEAKELREMGVQIPPDFLLDMSSLPMKRALKAKLKEMGDQQPPPPEMVEAETKKYEVDKRAETERLKAGTNVEIALIEAGTATAQQQAETERQQIQAVSQVETAAATPVPQPAAPPDLSQITQSLTMIIETLNRIGAPPPQPEQPAPPGPQIAAE